MVLLRGAGPELAVCSCVRIVRKSNGHSEVVTDTIANRKVPPSRKIAGPQDHAFSDIHRPWRCKAGTYYFASLDIRFLHQLLHSQCHASASVFSATILLRAHGVIRERLAVVID